MNHQYNFSVMSCYELKDNERLDMKRKIKNPKVDFDFKESNKLLDTIFFKKTIKLKLEEVIYI